MSLRQLTKQTGTHYLVRYRCDNKLQVRTSGFIKDADTVEIDRVYNVQWGNKSQADEAVIIAAGTKLEMKRRMVEEQAALRSSSSRSTSKPVASSERKRKANDSKTKSGKPAAKVLKVSSPPGLYPETTVELLENVITVATTASPSSETTVTTTALPGTTNTDLIPDTETATAMKTQPLLFTETETQLPFTATAVTSTVTITTTTTTPTATPNTPLTSKRDFIFRAARPMSPISGPMMTYIQAMEAAITHQAKEAEKMRRLMEASARRRDARPNERHKGTARNNGITAGNGYGSAANC